MYKYLHSNTSKADLVFHETTQIFCRVMIPSLASRLICRSRPVFSLQGKCCHAWASSGNDHDKHALLRACNVSTDQSQCTKSVDLSLSLKEYANYCSVHLCLFRFALHAEMLRCLNFHCSSGKPCEHDGQSGGFFNVNCLTLSFLHLLFCFVL